MASKFKFDPNQVIALGVLIASFAALFVYMRQASIMSEQTKILFEQTKANAWPSVKIVLRRDFDSTGIDEYQIYLHNRGIGPAIIEGVVVRYEGKVVQDWLDFYKSIDLPDSIPQYHGNASVQDLVIAPNDHITLVHWNNNKALLRYMFELADQLSVEVCYSSVYGDHWNVKREGFRGIKEKNERQALEDCGMQPEDLFEE